MQAPEQPQHQQRGRQAGTEQRPGGPATGVERRLHRRLHQRAAAWRHAGKGGRRKHQAPQRPPTVAPLQAVGHACPEKQRGLGQRVSGGQQQKCRHGGLGCPGLQHQPQQGGEQPHLADARPGENRLGMGVEHAAQRTIERRGEAQHHQRRAPAGCRFPQGSRRSAPSRPSLIISPDRMALAMGGATGCATGSQACTPRTPALMASPRPRLVSASGESASLPSWLNRRSRLSLAIKARPSSMATSASSIIPR